MIVRRRGLLGLLGAAVAAPLVARAEAMMPVRAWRWLPTPEDYGAVGNGVMDDTWALNAWLRASVAGGWEARLPAKTYRVSTGGLLIPRGARLLGNRSGGLAV